MSVPSRSVPFVVFADTFAPAMLTGMAVKNGPQSSELPAKNPGWRGKRAQIHCVQMPRRSTLVNSAADLVCTLARSGRYPYTHRQLGYPACTQALAQHEVRFPESDLSARTTRNPASGR